MSLLLFSLVIIFSYGIIFFLMPFYINFLKKRQINQEVSEYALQEYKDKAKTPIMGGLLFVVIPLLVCLIINHQMFKDPYVLFVALSYVLMCLIGFADDVLILLRHNNEGLKPSYKLIAQLLVAFILYFVFRDHLSNSIYLPFLHTDIKLGILYLPFMVLLYAAEANAVNFTDGMDGLCAGVSLIALIPFLLLFLSYNYSSIALLVIAIMASLLAYLHYNRFPARIFMGDSGSLALGGLFASLACGYGMEIVLFFAGGVFVIEMFCVLLQQVSVRLFHKRVFRYTPIHYAFKLKGISEERIVYSFYLVGIIFAIIALLIGVFG